MSLCLSISEPAIQAFQAFVVSEPLPSKGLRFQRLERQQIAYLAFQGLWTTPLVLCAIDKRDPDDEEDFQLGA